MIKGQGGISDADDSKTDRQQQFDDLFND